MFFLCSTKGVSAGAFLVSSPYNSFLHSILMYNLAETLCFVLYDFLNLLIKFILILLELKKYY